MIIEKLKCPKCKTIIAFDSDICRCNFCDTEMVKIRVHDLKPEPIIAEFKPIFKLRKKENRK